MAWIERLIDKVPDMTQTVGGLIMLAGVAATGIGAATLCPALWIVGTLVWMMGYAGPELAKSKQERIARARLAVEEAKEDAVFAATRAALERDAVARQQWREMIGDDRRSRGRLH